MKLQAYRKLKGISGAQAAQELDVGRITYWKWESGVQVPSSSSVAKIREWSGGAVTADDLIPPPGGDK